MTWTDLPALQTEQVLTAEHLNGLIANAEYLYGLEAFGACVFRMTRGAWSGHMLHWSKWLGWEIRVTELYADPAACSVIIQIDTNRDGTWATTILNQTPIAATGTLTGTFDLSSLGLTKGVVYAVRVIPTNVAIEVWQLSHHGSLPSAQGGYEWQTMSMALANGNVPTAADLGVWRNNLLYLRDQLGGPWTPTQPLDVANGAGLNQIFLAGAPTTHIYPASTDPTYFPWVGYVNHRSDYLAYRIGGYVDNASGFTDPHPIDLLYDHRQVGACEAFPFAADFTDNSQRVRWNGSVWTSSYDGSRATTGQIRYVEDRLAYLPSSTNAVDLAGAGTDKTNTTWNAASGGLVTNTLSHLAKRNWYEIHIARHRWIAGNTPTNNAWALLNYVFEVQGLPDAQEGANTWAAMTPLAHGDYPDVSAGQTLKKLDDNLVNILKPRIEDYPFLLCSNTPQTDKYFYRRGDLLLWKGTNVVLYYTKEPIPTAGQTQTLVSLGTTADTAAFDLRSLDMKVGAYYYLVNAEYAFELLGD